MAYCPNCGSESITLQRDTNIDWVRAAAGWVVFGVVGGALGAVTGADRNSNTCLNCGHRWKAAILYAQLETIHKLTGRELNLSQRGHREYCNRFAASIGPKLINLERSREVAIKGYEATIKSLSQLTPPSKCALTLFTFLVVLCAIAKNTEMAVSSFFLGILTVLLCALFLDRPYYNFREQDIQQRVEKEREKIEYDLKLLKNNIYRLAEEFDRQNQRLL